MAKRISNRLELALKAADGIARHLATAQDPKAELVDAFLRLLAHIEDPKNSKMDDLASRLADLEGNVRMLQTTLNFSQVN